MRVSESVYPLPPEDKTLAMPCFESSQRSWADRGRCFALACHLRADLPFLGNAIKIFESGFR
jgi:hypothetical protein